MDYYSFNQPRRDGWLSWPCWLTDSRCFTHKVVTRSTVSLEQDRESSPARTGVLTTMIRHQLGTCLTDQQQALETYITTDRRVIYSSCTPSRLKHYLLSLEQNGMNRSTMVQMVHAMNSPQTLGSNSHNCNMLYVLPISGTVRSQSFQPSNDNNHCKQMNNWMKA